MQATMMFWVFSSIMALAGAAMWWIINSLYSDIKLLRETKADKKEITDLKESINREIALQFENQDMQFKSQNQQLNFISACLKSMAEQSNLKIPDIKLD